MSDSLADTPFDTGFPLDELDLERPAPIETPWGSFAVFAVGEGYTAVDCWCPHMHGPLMQGTRRGDELACPWHGWRFSLVDGRCAWAPEGTARVASVRVLRVEVGRAGTVILHPPDE